MVPEQVVMLLVTDNVEVACNAVEKAAMETAVVNVDKGFAEAYATRRRHWEVRISMTHSLIRKVLTRLTFDSNDRGNLSGIQPLLLRLLQPIFQTSSASNRPDCKPNKLEFTKTLVSFSRSRYRLFTYCASIGLDAKRYLVGRPLSRPSSTVSYPRNDQLGLGYPAPSPAPDPQEDVMVAPTVQSHHQSIDRFGVRNRFAVYRFNITHSDSSPASNFGSRTTLDANTSAISLCFTSESRYPSPYTPNTHNRYTIG
jgi:CCR4-NOT transcription complex subunit 1